MTDAHATAAGPTPPARRTLRFVLWLAAGIGLIGLLLFWGGVGVSELARGVRSIPATAAPPLIAAQALIVLAGARKWQIVLRNLPGSPVKLPFALCSTATTLGVLLGQVLPIQIVTPAVRGWLARRHDVPLPRSVGGSVYEQMIDVLVLAAAGSASAMLWLFHTGWVSTLFAGALALILLTLSVRPLLRGMAKVASALARGALTQPMHALSNGLGEAARLPAQALRALVSLGLARYALLAALNVGLMHLLQPQVGPLVLLVAYPAILLVMSLPIFPGGLGVTEISWAGVLMAAGTPAPEAVEAALVLRILTTAAFLATVPGLLGFGMLAFRGGTR